MNITLKFKSSITTEETYPHCFEVTFVRDMRLNEYKTEDELFDLIFNIAHEFENIITKGLKVVNTTTECLGITFIHDAKSYQLLDLAKAGFQTIRGQ